MFRQIAKTLSMIGFASLVALTMMAASPQRANAGASVLFVDDSLGTSASLTSTAISAIQNSGFNTLVLFNMTVATNGDLDFDGQTVCTGGNYVGPSAWASQLSACLAGAGMGRIEFCIGGWGDPSFTNVENIFAAQGNNTNNILWKNLVALRALPISAIGFDDEQTYNASSAIEFGNMIGSIGYHLTLCPYTNQSYWQQVASGCSQYCDYCYLQTYSGGTGNDPANWASAIGGSVNRSRGVTVLPLYWDNDRSSVFYTDMQSWAGEGCVGGGLYLSCYQCNPSGILGEFPQYASWIHQAMPYFISSNGNPGQSLQATNDVYQQGGGGAAYQVADTPTNSGNGQQKWQINPIGSGEVMITNGSQSLQLTGNEYYNDTSYVGGCYEVVTTPTSWNSAQQYWTLYFAGNNTWAFVNASNTSLTLQATNDPYSNGSSYVSGCDKVAATPRSGGSPQEWWTLN